MKINIIGDIAGRFDELMLLLDKMPEADLILSVGDLGDRGPKIKEVFEWFMNTPNTEALYGNHEDMLVSGVEYGINDLQYWFIWLKNGGQATLKAYSKAPTASEAVKDIPAELVEWLKKRPMYFELDDLIVSHAPITSLRNVPADPYGRDSMFFWNRFNPKKPQSKFLINGHNGKFKRHKWGDGSEFGICIDNSHNDKLMGIHWPTKEIFEQDFIPIGETVEERARYEQREMTDEEKRIMRVLKDSQT